MGILRDNLSSFILVSFLDMNYIIPSKRICKEVDFKSITNGNIPLGGMGFRGNFRHDRGENLDNEPRKNRLKWSLIPFSR